MDNFIGGKLLADLIVGVDLGATKILAGIASAEGKIINRKKIPTNRQEGPAYILDRIAICVKEIIKENSSAGDEILGIALATPGPLSYRDSTVWDSPNLGWGRVAFKKELERRLGKTVIVDKDTNMAALGEFHFGRHGKYQHLLYVTVSTGIGGAVIIDGKLYRGKSGGAGECGHMVIDPSGPYCNCGRRGCLEALASGTAIARQAQGLIVQGKGQAILACAAGGEITAREVGLAARNGDSEAQTIITDLKEYLATGLANLINIFNPELIVLGGGVAMGLQDLLLKPLFASAREKVFALNNDGLELVLTSLGEDIGLYGCIASVMFRN